MRKQNGFVLLQVLLIFSVLVVIVSQLQYQQRIQVERAIYHLFLSQAKAYNDSFIELAAIGLKLDYEQTQNDHFQEQWNSKAASLYPLPDGGYIEFEIADLQGRFNINWLSKNNPNHLNARASFKKLLTELGANPEIATELHQWLDPNSGINYNYLDLSPSYAPSFYELSDLSELHLLKSVDIEQYQIIAPFLATLPSNQPLNLNTASAEVLLSTADFMTQAVVDEFMEKRNTKEGITDISEFTNHAIFQENDTGTRWLEDEKLTVRTSWFDLFLRITIDHHSFSQRNVLYRGENGISKVTFKDSSALTGNSAPGDPTLETKPKEE